MARRLIFLLFFLPLPPPAFPQDVSNTAEKISAVKKIYDEGRWEDVVRAVPESPDQPADLELYRGLALAQLQRWPEAQKALEASLRRNPRDKRFLVELAGIAYRQKQFSAAKTDLGHALKLASGDDYANNFLASIYFLEGNLEGALKYWNRMGKPQLSDLSFDPQPHVHSLLLDRAFAFSPRTEWRRDSYLTTEARLDALQIFMRTRFDLSAQSDGSFDLTFGSVERNGWGIGKWESLLSLLRGLPYLTVFPEFYNLDHSGLNWLSLVRWDDERRRVFSEISAPIREDPKWRYRIYVDGRNENWNITNTFRPAGASAASLNLEKAEVGAEIQSIVSGRWNWTNGVEYSYRRFRNLQGIAAAAVPFFTDGSSLSYRGRVERSLVRFPERRFTLDSSASGEFGTIFAKPLGNFGRVQGSLSSDWLPQARGEDYKMQTQLRGGRTVGKVPFDEMFMLGFERDNDLWLRGHNGLRDGKKGNAPLGRNYVLANWETNKIAYDGAFFKVRVGPFLDSGKIYDPSGFFGSRKWLWDTGVQAKVRVLGSFEFVLGYGKDLRAGTNSFFTTVSR
ncbi:MAG: tetratricopeptide repeat protein [Candidatus Acidiferrales bacterium]